jgi:hypothetical protein
LNIKLNQSDNAPRLTYFSLRKIAMKSSSIIVATLFSALALPVFAQTGTTATPAAAPATTAAAPKAEHAAKHKTVKHTVKKEKTSTASTAPAAGTDTAAVKSK